MSHHWYSFRDFYDTRAPDSPIPASLPSLVSIPYSSSSNEQQIPRPELIRSKTSLKKDSGFSQRAKVYLLLAILLLIGLYIVYHHFCIEPDIDF
jgi:hypothetical protein